MRKTYMRKNSVKEAKQRAIVDAHLHPICQQFNNGDIELSDIMNISASLFLTALLKMEQEDRENQYDEFCQAVLDRIMSATRGKLVCEEHGNA